MGTRFIYDRSHITVDPRVLAIAGTEHVGFSSTRQTSRAQSAKRREVFGESHVCSANRMKGELHPTKNRL